MYNPNEEEFDEWFNHPVTKAVHAFYMRESEAHREILGYGSLLDNEKTFEKIGQEYMVNITKADLFESLSHLTCDDIQVEEEDHNVVNIPIEEDDNEEA